MTGVVLAVVVALLRGGKLEGLGEVGLQALPLAVLALFMRTAVGFLEPRGFMYGPALQISAYLFLFPAVWLNLDKPGLKLFGLGSLLNFIVIAANGGRMPVSERAMEIVGVNGTPTGIHSLMTPQTRLWFLADVIPIRTPWVTIISVGDILIVIGIFLFIQYRMLYGTEAAALVSSGK